MGERSEEKYEDYLQSQSAKVYHSNFMLLLLVSICVLSVFCGLNLFCLYGTH